MANNSAQYSEYGRDIIREKYIHNPRKIQLYSEKRDEWVGGIDVYFAVSRFSMCLFSLRKNRVYNTGLSVGTMEETSFSVISSDKEKSCRSR